MAPSSPSSSGQTLDHPPSPSSSSDLHHPPASPEPQTSNMSFIEEKSVSIAGASALKSKKPTQAGFPFLSLPPEIRNMIYHYIFTPVKNGNCWVIYASFAGDCLKGRRYECDSCKVSLMHNTCRADYVNIAGFHYTFELSHDYTKPAILQTCKTILEEATPVSLAHIHISVHSSHNSDYFIKSLRCFLRCVRKSGESYLSRLTYTVYMMFTNSSEFLAQNIDRLGIRIGHLVLHEVTSSAVDLDVIKHFVTNLDGLKHKPARVEWLPRYTGLAYPYEHLRTEFNEAAQRWLANSAALEAADGRPQQPLLRDYLPQYFDQSSD